MHRHDEVRIVDTEEEEVASMSRGVFHLGQDRAEDVVDVRVGACKPGGSRLLVVPQPSLRPSMTSDGPGQRRQKGSSGSRSVMQAGLACDGDVCASGTIVRIWHEERGC